MMQDRTGQVAVVTGAGSGIGRGMVRRFAAAGMRVAATDIEAEALAETAALVAAETPASEIWSEVLDVRDPVAMAAVADETFERWGQVDLLCNNAGVFVGGFLWERTPEDLDFTLGVNLHGILHAVRSFVPRMTARGVEAHVVNTVSIAGLLGSAYAGPYGISKFAAFAATESLAGDLRAIGSPVQAHALCPGMIRTRIAESERNRPEELASVRTEDQVLVEGFLADTVAGGMEPEQVADIVLEALEHPDRFVILTHPEFAAQVEDRGRALAQLRLPTIPQFD